MLSFPQTVRLGNAEQVLSQLAQAMQNSPAGGELRLDASALHDFDSAVLAVLLHCKRLAKASTRTLAVVGAPPKLVELARVYGLTPLLWPEA